MKLRIHATAAVVLGCAMAAGTATAERGCGASAQLLRLACEVDAQDSFHTTRAICLDSSMPSDDCLSEADTALGETLEECASVLGARQALCDALNDAPHEPAFDADAASSFIDPRDIGGSVTPNTWFPLVAGNTWTYADPSGSETIVVTVTENTKLINGIRCVVVNDAVTEDGAVVENTDDWFAQDVDGNVWYCGEIASNFKSFEGDAPAEPELVDIDGSFKNGRDGARGGVLLPQVPMVGVLFRQEVAYGDAEDVIEILDTAGTESAPGGMCAGTCLVTRDFTPLDPEVEENKYYAPGLGLIVEIDLETGGRVELQSFSAGQEDSE